MINKESMLKENQKLLIESFNLQNFQAYDEALEKIEQVANNLIEIIESKEKNSEFYMRIMPIIKQERQLVSEKDYQEFLNKNQRTLSKNFEKNAYLAFLMQQIQQKSQPQKNRMTSTPQTPRDSSSHKTQSKNSKYKKKECEIVEAFDSESPRMDNPYEQFQVVNNSNLNGQSKLVGEDEKTIEKMMDEGAQLYFLLERFGDRYEEREIRRKYNKYLKKRGL